MEMKENYQLNILFFWSSFLITCFACECLLPYLKKKTKKVKIKIYHHNNFYKFIFICCIVFHIYILVFKRELYTSKVLYLVYAVLSACVYICLRQELHSKAEVNMLLKDKESIGALWAHQTYDAYYSRTFGNILERMQSFEEKYNVQFFIKKLLIVIPLSCDIEGIFTQKDSSIEMFGELEILEDDAGWNYNRQFKHPVYKIYSSRDVYIVAEYSQPVSALSRSRFILDNENFIYIRDCYVKTLKLLLQGSPSILVIHDDENASESLSSSVLSTIEKEWRGAHFTV